MSYRKSKQTPRWLQPLDGGLGISQRNIDRLINGGVLTFQQLIVLSTEDFLAIKGCGPHTLKNVAYSLDTLGYKHNLNYEEALKLASQLSGIIKLRTAVSDLPVCNSLRKHLKGMDCLNVYDVLNLSTSELMYSQDVNTKRIYDFVELLESSGVEHDFDLPDRHAATSPTIKSKTSKPGNALTDTMLKELNSIYDLDLSGLDFSVRALKVFEKHHIHTVRDLSNITGDELNSFDGLGAKSIFEIVSLLDEYKIEHKLQRAISGRFIHRQSVETLPTTDSSIKDAPLSVRAINALARAGIKTVSDLLETNVSELMLIPDLGAKTFNEASVFIRNYKEQQIREVN